MCNSRLLIVSTFSINTYLKIEIYKKNVKNLK